MAEATAEIKTDLVRKVGVVNSPKVGAEFLTKLPKKEVFPSFFSVLTSARPLREKTIALSNVREALSDPKASGLSANIIDSPAEFLDKLLIETAKNPSRTLSPGSKDCLDKIRTNFEREIQRNRVMVTSGGETIILTRDVDPKYLIDAIFYALTRKDQPLEFRRTLVKTFLNWSSKSNFHIGVLSGDFSPHFARETTIPPESGRASSKKTPEEIRLENALNLTQHELMKANIDLADRVRQVLRQQAEIRELSGQLREARSGTVSKGELNLDPLVPHDWYKVLDVIPLATPERILSNFRARQKMFHPDAVLAPLEAAGIGRDTPLYKALQNFANQWTTAINNAYAAAKREGKVNNSGK